MRCDGIATAAAASAAAGAADLPLGSHHDEHGLLLKDGGSLVLRRDDGGQWRLDADRDARRFLGGRVRVEGTRSGFDILSVERLTPC